MTRCLTAAALVTLGWSTAHLLGSLLGWRASEPALALTAPVAEDSGGSRRVLARWFAAPEAGKPAVAPLSGLELIAVIAGERGVALISGIEAQPVAVQVGKDARPGLRLLEVQRDRAVFDQGGARVELPFPAHASAAALIAGMMPAEAPRAAPPENRQADAAPVSQENASVSRGRLTSIAQTGNLGDWDKGLSNFPSGGIQITSAAEQPLARVLDLKDGDIIRQVNNREIKQLADVSLVYHYFSQAQDVNLQILRDGKPVQINFKITP
ncbi:PDZ domain-containing protein [Uliginosibacterium paludis]|uniref:PDZ domain-containing protein n=1 Tax=Uliginosibacterium paludis TaxID=1615952 RepID=A0ABV2CLX2_9RHOO